MGGWRLSDSPFLNPYTVKAEGLDQALVKFDLYLRSNPVLLSQLKTLANKRLGCFCPLNQSCHVDILIKVGHELAYW